MKNEFSLGKLFTLYYVGGNCPVQAEGECIGYYFYFRSRGNRASIEFTTTKNNWENGYIIYSDYELYKTKGEYEAGWISRKLAKKLIFKGCMQFLWFYFNKLIKTKFNNDKKK